MAAQKIARQVRTRSVSRRVPKHASDRLKRHRPLLIGRYGLTRRQQSELLRHRGEAKYDGQTLEQNLRGFAGSPQYNALQTDEARWEAIQKRIAIYDRIAQAKLLAEDAALKQQHDADLERTRRVRAGLLEQPP